MQDYKQKDLLKLQTEWYEKLRESGFRDIEMVSTEIRWYKRSSNSYHGRTKMQRQCKEEYFTLMNHAIEKPTTVFRNPIEEYIMRRYVEGALIRDIVKELLERGTPKERKTIRIIIRRYEMAWDVRRYTDQQLNRKPRKAKSDLLNHSI